jgi:hypothetical protein
MSILAVPTVIEGTDLEKTPPCMVRKVADDSCCTRASDHRVAITACERGCRPVMIFICQPDLDLISTHGALCGDCLLGMRRIDRYC